MDHDRLPVNAINTRTSLDYEDVVPAPHEQMNQSVLPTDKGDLEDYKEKDHGHQQTTLDIESVEQTYVIGDPLDLGPGVADEPTQFTIRAVLVGCALGAVVQASNLYLGLKTGFTFGPQLLGALGGFLILKPLSKVIPKTLPSWVGVGNFGPRENVTCQTAATAAGGLGILFVSGFPAMYQVGLLGAKPSDDIGKLIGYMFAVAFYGMSFAIPLRSFFILRQRLTFPTPSATAYAIRSLHSTTSGASDAKKKGKWLFWTFLGCFIQKTVSTYIPGIIYDWHFFYWIAGWGAPKAQLIENWGWYLEITPAFLGAGILSGMNASWSFYGGTILAWAIIGPALVATGHAAGSNTQAKHDTVLPYRSYYNMSPEDPAGNETSPRYCLLWIGVLIMLVAAFVELACEWKTIGAGFVPLALKVRNFFRRRSGKEPLVGKVMPLIDPVPKKDQVPIWVWAPMSLVAIVITCVVLGVAFEVNVGLSILGVILSVLFCFIGVLSAGATDINPVSTVAKATQLIFGGATKGKYTDSIDPTTGWNLHAMRVNLLAGMVAAGAAAQSTDMTGDLKTGHLIGAKPIVQYFAQLIGAFCSIFLTVAFFILFTQASPCILDRDAEVCQYSVPSAAAWYAVSIVVTTTGGLPIPKVAGILAIVLSIVGGALIVYRVYFCPQKYKVWVPNPSAVGLAMVLNATTYSSAMAIGATAGYIWKKKKPEHFESVAFAFAAGGLVGEGLGGVMQAILTIAGAGPEKGVTVGVPEY